MAQFENDPNILGSYLEAALPEKCRNCPKAQAFIMVLVAFEDSTGGPDSVIKDIEEKCPGYEGGEYNTMEAEVDGKRFYGVSTSALGEPCPYMELSED